MPWLLTATAAHLAAAHLTAAAATPARAPDPGLCLLGRAETAVRTLLMSEPGSREERAAVDTLRPRAEQCGAVAGASDNEAGAAFRGAIARAYFRKRLPGLWSGPNSNPDFSPNLFMVQRGYEQAGTMQQPYRLAHCITAVNFNAASRVAHALPDSAAEAAALADLRPSLSACLDAGQRFALPAAVLRDAIAIVLAQEIAFPFNRTTRRH
ncbi:MAG: hypothetical protein JO013_11135 [Alphaproteobacteria bacterium]|nr:hypothetical protein [Alphaproteobacteria bacterium]